MSEQDDLIARVLATTGKERYDLVGQIAEQLRTDPAPWRAYMVRLLALPDASYETQEQREEASYDSLGYGTGETYMVEWTARHESPLPRALFSLAPFCQIELVDLLVHAPTVLVANLVAVTATDEARRLLFAALPGLPDDRASRVLLTMFNVDWTKHPPPEPLPPIADVIVRWCNAENHEWRVAWVSRLCAALSDEGRAAFRAQLAAAGLQI